VAVTAIPLTTGSSTSNTASYTTASISPTPGRLVLAAVLATVGSGTVDVTLSGCGLTWVKVDQTPAAARTVHLFRAMGTPAAGSLTIAGSSQMTSALWQVTEFNGTDTSGANGSGAIVQAVNSRPGSATSVTVAFNQPVNAANTTYGAVGIAAQEAPAVGGAPWTSLGSTTQSAPTSGLLAEIAAVARQEIAASWTTSAASFVVGAEIAAVAVVVSGLYPGAAVYPSASQYPGAATTPTGAANGSWSFTGGTATGAANYRGTAAAGTWTFTGAAVGGNAPVGRAAGTWTFTGAASGTTTRTGTATSGAWGFTGAATGSHLSSGTASGTWRFTGDAVGRTPVVVAISHTYGFATLTSATVGTAALTPTPLGTAALAASATGDATLTYSPGLATLQTDS